MIKTTGFFLVVYSALALLACTDAALEGMPPPPPAIADNKLAISGEVCTKDPEELVFPLRVVFLVDCSESMAVTDQANAVTGETGRERAVRETVEDLLSRGGDVKISVVRFHSAAQPLTAELDDDGQYLSYFSDDLTYINARIAGLGLTERTTNYIRALSEAYAEIRHELMNAEQESLALSTYHVIMVTDGIPDVEGDETRENSTDNILDAVEGIMDLGRLFHIDNMAVSTAFLSTNSPEVNKVAEDQLQAMAEQGNGTYRSFASGGELNFLHINLTTLRRVFTLKTLVAQNINAVVDTDEVLADSDGDGLDDETEFGIDSNPFSPDTDGDGCRDGMEYRYKTSGMDPIDPGDCLCYVPDYCFDDNDDGLCDCDDGEAPGSCCQDEDGDGLCDCIDADGDGRCDPENYVDSDGDGLFNCEERYTGTNRSGADSDGDGLVDFLELRFGTSPDINDIADDLDWDAVVNGEEVRTATDPGHENPGGRSDQAYRYQLWESKVEQSQTCYGFDIENITLTEVISGTEAEHTTGPAGQGYSGTNRILIYMGEVPFDDFESYARFRVACVEATYRYDGNYKSPPSGFVRLTDADFVNLADFDPDNPELAESELHCIPPGGR
jgi:hypothetical protein